MTNLADKLQQLSIERSRLDDTIVHLEVDIVHYGSVAEKYAMLSQLESLYKLHFALSADIRATLEEMQKPKSVFKRLFRK